LSLVGCLFAYLEWKNFSIPTKVDSFAPQIDRAQRMRRDLTLVRPLIYFDKSAREDMSMLDDFIRLKPIIGQLFSGGEKNFLVVMQNNTELRASGGIWGSYGKLKIKDGKVESFQTDDTYTLDEANVGKFAPPVEVAEIIDDQWRFWNANWSPDFAKSAEQGLYFYSQVDKDTHFDGVIGPDLDLALNLLSISGPVKIDGYDFDLTKDNFVQKMVYDQVSDAVLASNQLPQSTIKPDQKNIMLAKIAVEIFNQAIKSGKQIDALKTIYKDLKNNDLQIYLTDANQQKIIDQLGWAKKIASDKNFAMVVDSNLGSKLDFVIDKNLTITKVDEKTYKATIEYKNNLDLGSDQGKQAFKNYRTFTRLFLPKGSKMVSQTGADMQFGLSHDQQTDCEYISATVVVKPGETGQLSFLWQPPENLVGAKLSVLRQAGSHVIINQ
jgi:hypothetical protein